MLRQFLNRCPALARMHTPGPMKHPDPGRWKNMSTWMVPDAVQQRIKKVSTEINGRTLSIETVRLAEQAMGAVVVRYGDSMVLATVVGEREAKDMPFFPLTVDYEERMYAAGK